MNFNTYFYLKVGCNELQTAHEPNLYPNVTGVLEGHLIEVQIYKYTYINHLWVDCSRDNPTYSNQSGGRLRDKMWICNERNISPPRLFNTLSHHSLLNQLTIPFFQTLTIIMFPLITLSIVATVLFSPPSTFFCTS